MSNCQTPAGPRYTRNGQFTRRADGILTTTAGDVVRGTKGEITLGNGPIQIDESGNVRAGGTLAGALKIEGRGRYDISTGIRFFDHMLESFARHGGSFARECRALASQRRAFARHGGALASADHPGPPRHLQHRPQ